MAALLLFVLLLAVLLNHAFGSRWRDAARRAVGPAVKLGAFGFAAGFFGPMVLTPGANQGPLLGIFITGPGGFLLGFIFGIARELLGRAPAPPAT